MDDLGGDIRVFLQRQQFFVKNPLIGVDSIFTVGIIGLIGGRALSSLSLRQSDPLFFCAKNVYLAVWYPAGPAAQPAMRAVNNRNELIIDFLAEGNNIAGK